MGLPRIIGITGYARHGKDTVANVLTRELGYNRVALADKMKELLLKLDPTIYEAGGIAMRLTELVVLKGWEGAKEHGEVRRLLQVFGTEVGREGLGEDIWIETLANSTKGFYGNERKIVIPDIRFTNEAAFIRRMHGEVWRVNRLDFDNGLGTGHASERDIPVLRADEVIANDGTKAQLQDKVIRLARFKMALADAMAANRPALDALADR